MKCRSRDASKGSGIWKVPNNDVLVQLTFLAQIYNAMKHGALADLHLPETIVLAGHSRGGKLAALHFAEGDLHAAT